MSRVSLLNSNEAVFGFEHWMAHRDALGVMSPLVRFSVIPYFLDPLLNLGEPAGPWHFNHQQAHNDAANNLPATYLGDIVPLGIALGANLVDSNLNDAWNRSWWTFQNHIEHYIGSAVILPQPQTLPPAPAPMFTYPFW